MSSKRGSLTRRAINEKPDNLSSVQPIKECPSKLHDHVLQNRLNEKKQEENGKESNSLSEENESEETCADALTQNNSNKKRSTSQNKSSAVSYQLFITVSVAAVILYLGLTKWVFIMRQNNVVIDGVTQLIQNLKSNADEQPNLTYKIISAALKPILNNVDEPSSPAIITVLANKGASENAKQFCTRLAEFLVPNRYVMIDGEKYGKGNKDGIKLKIDEEIRSKFKFHSLNAAVVHQLEKIPLNATMIFHNYCDHDNATFKRVVYMFVLSLNEVLALNTETKRLDSVAMKHYRNTWHHAHPDEIESLITRLTANVINVK